MLKAKGGLTLWRTGVLVTVAALAAGGAYGAYQFVNGTDSDGLGESQQLYAVTKRDLVNEVSVNGSLVFPNREILSFGLPGIVGQVLVSEGDSVTEGQPLAVLDMESIATLEQAVAQAAVNLRDAEEALENVSAPYSALDIAQAEADVANAHSAYKVAADAAEALTMTPSHAIARAESQVAGARLAVRDADEALAATLAPTAQEITQAEVIVADAAVAVADASESLRALIRGPDEDMVSGAQSRIDTVVMALTSAELGLTITRNEWEHQLEGASDAVETAADVYSATFVRWLGVELTEAERTTDPDALLESWSAELASLFDPGSRFTDLVPYVAIQGVPSDDPETRWNESTVYLWANFYPGGIAATCDDGMIPFQGDCVRHEMDSAWEDIPPAMENLKTLETQATMATLNADAVVLRARDDLAEAEDALTDLYVEPDPLDIKASEIAVELAKATRQDAEEDLAELTGGPDVLEVESKEKQLTLATAELREAEEELADLLAGPDPVHVAASRKQVELASARVADTEEALDEMIAGPDPAFLALKKADLAASSAALVSARNRLERGTLRAPWDAVVSAIDVTPGKQVNVSTPAFEVLDKSVVEVDGVVDEIDILSIREGASASVTMDALQGKALQGIVSQVAGTAQSRQGIVSYPISIRVEAPASLSLPEGLSAVATVVIREDRGVLLVPLDALHGTFDQPVVRVMNDGVIEERPVSLGNSDDFWVVVQAGISEGDRVVIRSKEAASAGFAALKSSTFVGGQGKSAGGGK